ncbi:MAG: outer membrane lipoprotein LolB [Rubrivivax sp.]|nr:outer membrane lipoprotein LolB [Rubrivivax sp.]
MRGLLAALAVGALLAGCATPPRESADWTVGRLSLRVDAGEAQAAQSLSAGFELRGDGREGELRLSTPLGNRMAEARWSPGSAVLDDGRGERRFATLDELSRAALGEPLPLAALPDWLAGRPWPGAAHATTAEGFEQLGWQVATARRADGVVEARRAAPPAVWLRVRLEEAAR